MLRKNVKRAVEGVLSHGIPGWVGRRRMSRRRLILAYHNVVGGSNRGVGERALHIPVDGFARQLDILSECAHVVPLSVLLEPCGEGREDPRPLVALTFDDGYRGALTLGLREMQARGMPATFFIAPGLLGDRTLWWDGLASATAGGFEALRRYALDSLGGRPDSIVGWARSRGMKTQEMRSELRTVTAEELAGIPATDGVALGAHGWSHACLPRLEPDELRAELDAVLLWLRSFRTASPLLAYPYGHSSPTVWRAAEAAGYEGSFLVDGGWLPRAPGTQFDLPRLTVSRGLSPQGFRARLSGFLCGS